MQCQSGSRKEHVMKPSANMLQNCKNANKTKKSLVL